MGFHPATATPLPASPVPNVTAARQIWLTELLRFLERDLDAPSSPGCRTQSAALKKPVQAVWQHVPGSRRVLPRRGLSRSALARLQAELRGAVRVLLTQGRWPLRARRLWLVKPAGSPLARLVWAPNPTLEDASRWTATELLQDAPGLRLCALTACRWPFLGRGTSPYCSSVHALRAAIHLVPPCWPTAAVPEPAPAPRPGVDPPQVPVATRPHGSVYRHRNQGEPMELLSGARIGLWKAILDYGPASPVPFAWYAAIRIRGETLDGLQKQD